ncbi:HAD-IB family phosphatase [Dactylosporangium maewongense]|uniref:HAD family hydrolase n=1 Tax=Dactylosporangium maewongense TaxID=634393 RepID=UPI0031CFF9DF
MVVRLVAFDLDGTLTRGPTCLEATAARHGFAEQMAIWERARGDDAIIEIRDAVWALLSGWTPEQLTAPLADIPLAPGAAAGIAALHAAGIDVAIVSLGFAPHVTHFAEQLGVATVIATEILAGGGFRHVFPSSKPVLLEQYATSRGWSLADVAAVGDSHGDVPMLRACGMSVFVGPDLPDDLTPTAHLPGAAIDHLAALCLQANTTRPIETPAILAADVSTSH